jgi:hypothetical protein
MADVPDSAIYELSNSGERLTTRYPIRIHGRPEYFKFIILIRIRDHGRPTP